VDEDLKQEIMRHNGSVQNIDAIPQDLKEPIQNRLGNVDERHYRHVAPHEVILLTSRNR
jgi:hypothetical protein